MLVTIPKSAADLAGYALAHAVWSISDTTPDDLLCPLAITDDATGRVLMRFEAESQEAAILGGQEAMAEQTKRGIAWAFAREGILRHSNALLAGRDVILVSVWAPGLSQPVNVVQPFQRACADHGFRIGTILLVVDGEPVPEPLAADPLAAIHAGIESHPVARNLWPVWQSPAEGDQQTSQPGP